MSKIMYRVSDELRTEATAGNITTALVVYEQCGFFFYFASFHNACIAAAHFETGIDVLPYCSATGKADGTFAGSK
jgi:hypothetical protein